MSTENMSPPILPDERYFEVDAAKAASLIKRKDGEDGYEQYNEEVVAHFLNLRPDIGIGEVRFPVSGGFTRAGDGLYISGHCEGIYGPDGPREVYAIDVEPQKATWCGLVKQLLHLPPNEQDSDMRVVRVAIFSSQATPHQRA